MERVLIFGCSGSGKSTLARKLGELTGLEVIHLDRHYWRPGWQEPTKAEWTGQVQALLSKDQWIIDGQYGGTLFEARMERADTLIYLDRSRWVCMWRVVKRYWINRHRSRPDIAQGCPERLDKKFLWYVWTYPQRRPKYLAKLREQVNRRRVVILRSDREIAQWLHTLQSQSSAVV